MNQAEHQTLQTLNQYFIKPQVVKKVTQLILSVSLFSFFFSCSSWLSLLLHSLSFYFSAFPFQMFSYVTGKSCIFLLCNGILVFLSRNSYLISSSSSGGSDYSDQFLKNNGDDSPLVSLLSEAKELLLDKEVVMESTIGCQEIAVHVEEGRENECLIEGQEGETQKSIVEDEEGETECGLLIMAEEREEEEETVRENEEEKETESIFFIEEGEDDELLSTEELNKKFDDFIRRMKEGFRIEAQQQLVVVKY